MAWTIHSLLALGVTGAAGLSVARTRSDQTDGTLAVTSREGVLLRLLRTPKEAGDGHELAVARSYDGHAWEGTGIAAAEVTCDQQCTFDYDEAFTYAVETTTISGKAHEHARLLAQGTFGAHAGELEEGVSAEEWFRAQVGLPPSLSFEYIRQRQNAQWMDGMGGATFGPCDVHSRWHRFAFSIADEGRDIEVNLEGGAFHISLDGVFLTTVPKDALKPALSGTYEVCRVIERGGYEIVLGKDSDCDSSNLVKLTSGNPILDHAGGAVTAPVLSAEVVGLEGVPGVVIATEAPNCADVDDTKVVYFLQADGGAIYRFNRRVKLFANTPEAPASETKGLLDRCPAAAPTPFNAAHCMRTEGCGWSCGFRGEVANDPRKGHRYALDFDDRVQDRADSVRDMDWPQHILYQKSLPLHNMALTVDDQLRLRVAWALVQRIPIAEDLGVRSSSSPYAAYFDIFISHAFGNYRDILKEVSYSPLMGQYLSYRRNYAYVVNDQLPDQNYAREIMQLFSIGLYKMHMDGSPDLGASGEDEQTYTVKDIVTMSRAWTGFDTRGRRGNTETASPNYWDAMAINPEHRDVFPKTDLTGGYIGDGYPLCSTLPPKHFARPGATYVYAGTSSLDRNGYDEYPAPVAKDCFADVAVTVKVAKPAACVSWTHCGNRDSTSQARFQIELESEQPAWPSCMEPEQYFVGEDGQSMQIYALLQNKQGGKRMQFWMLQSASDAVTQEDYDAMLEEFNTKFPVGTTLTLHNSPVVGDAPPALEQYAPPADSALYSALCAADANGCTYPHTVTLDDEAACQPEDAMCNAADTLTTVKVVEGGAAHYYTYARPPCVRLAVYDGKVSSWKKNKYKAVDSYAQCADPSVAMAGAVCCDKAGHVEQATKAQHCHSLGELMTFATAAARCEAQGAAVCAAAGRMEPIDHHSACGDSAAAWLDEACVVKVQVSRGGLVNLVDPLNEKRSYPDKKFDKSTENNFYPVWAAAGPPTEAAQGCATEEDGSLLCDATIEEVPVFPDAAPSKAQAEGQLRIGAFPPDAYEGEYTCMPPCTGEVQVYTRGGGMDAASIIGVQQAPSRGGGMKWYLNRESRVHVGGTHFRNAPAFMPLMGEAANGKDWSKLTEFAAARAAAHETDAVLDHLFYHQNTAPFVARYLIQRLVTSNPSPRYIKVAATAFATGTYGSHGSGRYGCLEATVAAVLLDREARSATLDADPGHGKTQEPLLKVLQVMRSLEFRTRVGQEVNLFAMQDAIGQDAWYSPSVFGYYSEDYSPKGAMQRAGHVSPEADLVQAPALFGLINGLTALVKEGLTSDGFGASAVAPNAMKRWMAPGNLPDGTLTFDPFEGAADSMPTPAEVSDMIDKLDALLLQGRLSAATKKAITDALPVYDAGQTQDPLACGDGFKLETHCSKLNCEGCRAGDLCRSKTSRRLWVPPNGCKRVRGKPYAARFDGEDDVPCCAKVDPAKARADLVKLTLELLLVAPEFHTTNLRLPTGTKREEKDASPKDGEKGYKAVVVVLLQGGADSWSWLVPPEDSGKCKGDLSYKHYQDVRDLAAPATKNLKNVKVGDASHEQPCSEFLVNDDIMNIREMFELGQASFFANVGNLVEPVDKETMKGDAELPPHLFAHNVQQKHMQSMHAQNRGASYGVAGRMADALRRYEVGTNMYSFRSFHHMAFAENVDATLLSLEGVDTLESYGTHKGAIDAMAEGGSGSLFAENYGSILQTAVGVSERLQEDLEAQHVQDQADEKRKKKEAKAAGTKVEAKVEFPDTKSGKQLDIVSQVIKLRDGKKERLADRDVFVLELGGFDAHNRFDNPSIVELDAALAKFRLEMIAQGEWENVVLLGVSDFGRTLTSNGKGTDHAWGGNYFAVGGGLKGGNVLGTYPDRLDAGSPQDYGHGIVIPTSGYELMWGPVMEWFGVAFSEWDAVLPNRRNFPSARAGSLFEETPHHFVPVCDYRDQIDCEGDADCAWAAGKCVAPSAPAPETLFRGAGEAEDEAECSSNAWFLAFVALLAAACLLQAGVWFMCVRKPAEVPSFKNAENPTTTPIVTHIDPPPNNEVHALGLLPSNAVSGGRRSRANTNASCVSMGSQQLTPPKRSPATHPLIA